MQPGKYTELFFLDEATAFAAGHRPCALCRREDYNRFVELWPHADDVGADAIDARLHVERLGPRHEASFDDLPDGAFVLGDGTPSLVLGRELLAWSSEGYTARRSRPSGRASVITPRSIVAVLRAGWEPVVPFLHPSAHTRGAGPRSPSRSA